MKKKKRVLESSLALIILVCLLVASGCGKGVNSKKAIKNGEIYPTGDIKTAKIFDEFHNEKPVTLNQNDVEYIIQIIKSSDKELGTYNNSPLELNVSLTDSVIQLIREDDEIIYYVFHNGKINGICYKIHSKELSEWILNIGDQ